jgi:hypothetical protein
MFYNDNEEDLKLWPGKTIQIMPAPGWSVTWNLDTPHRHTEPLVGWALRADGIVEPMTADETGGVDAGEVQGLIHQIHPTEDQTAFTRPSDRRRQGPQRVVIRRPLPTLHRNPPPRRRQ